MEEELEVEKFLSKFPELKISECGKRVRCLLSGHEMPYKLDVLHSYVQGKKFSTLKLHNDFNYASLDPLIVQSKRRKHQLFCALTNCYISKKPDEVRSHISGKRYKQSLLQYKAGERNLFEEYSKRLEDTSNKDTDLNDGEKECESGQHLSDSESESYPREAKVKTDEEEIEEEKEEDRVINSCRDIKPTIVGKRKKRKEKYVALAKKLKALQKRPRIADDN